MNDDVLSKMLVVNVIGADTVSNEVMKRAIHGISRAGHVSIPDAIKSLQFRKNPPEDEFSVFMEIVGQHFAEGIRVLFVTGFPRFHVDARQMMRVCPHLFVFAIENGDKPSSIVENVTTDFRTLARFQTVDARRSPGRFINNHIVRGVESMQLEKMASSLPRSTVPKKQHAYA